MLEQSIISIGLSLKKDPFIHNMSKGNWFWRFLWNVNQITYNLEIWHFSFYIFSLGTLKKKVRGLIYESRRVCFCCFRKNRRSDKNIGLSAKNEWFNVSQQIDSFSRSLQWRIQTFIWGRRGAVSKKYFSPLSGGEGEEPGLSPGSATGLKAYKSYTVSSKLFIERTNLIK